MTKDSEESKHREGNGSQLVKFRESAKSTAKFVNLTGIRGYAAIWVVCFHYQSTSAVASLNMGSIIGHGYLGVDIFFVLSGLILSLNYASKAKTGVPGSKLFPDFIIKRFARVYPLHLATFVVIFVVWEAASTFGNYRFRTQVANTVWTAVCNLFLVHAWAVTPDLSWNIPSWSVSAEWFAYLLIAPALFLCLKDRSLKICVAVSMTLWCIFLCYLFLFRKGDLNYITTDGVTRILPEFVGGYTLYRWLEKPLHHSSGDLLVGFGASGLGFICYFDRQALIFLLPAVMLLLAGLYRGGRFADALFGNLAVVFLGEISYSIYMCQMFVQMGTNAIVRRLTLTDSRLTGLIVLCIEMTFVVLCAYVLHVTVELPARLAVLKRSGRILGRYLDNQSTRL